MAYVRVGFDIAGDVQYSRAFDLYGKLASDLSEPLADIGDKLLQAVGDQFATEGAHGLGRRWQPLSQAYAAWKEQHYPGRPILVRTGDMRSAALSKGALSVSPRRLTYEVDSEYAIYHQEGRGVPQRKIVALSNADRRDWDRVFAEYLAAERHRVGL